MKGFIRQNQWFLGPYVIILLIALYQLVSKDKGFFVLYFDSVKGDWFEALFTGLTYLGDGILAVAVCVILLFVSKRYFFTVSAALLVNTVVVQSLKHLIQAPRPRKFFEAIQVLQDNRYSDASYMLSMPSGHTALAFCLFGTIAFLAKKSAHGYFYLSLAVAVGISRMVLAQHFLEDVVAGSFIGVTTALLAVSIAKNKMPHNSDFDKPVIAWRG